MRLQVYLKFNFKVNILSPQLRRLPFTPKSQRHAKNCLEDSHLENKILQY